MVSCWIERRCEDGFTDAIAATLEEAGVSESKRRQRETGRIGEPLRAAAARISAALRKYATAASAHLGNDCHVHAELGRVLLEDLGFKARAVLGFAAWRVGEGPDDVIGHIPCLKGHLPAGAQGFAYHAWLECGGWLVDFTTYQLRTKAQALDEADGGRTNVTWCPEFLCVTREELRSHRDLIVARRGGLAYYEARPELERVLRSQFQLDPTDLYAVRLLLLANPEVTVLGPNDLKG